jgi:RimJ/RimL family protein N-acetyltransferase
METVALRDGSEAVIRPLEPDDYERIREVWNGMSAISRRRRFLTPSNSDLTDLDLHYLVDVDHRRHEAMLALAGEADGGAVGVARYVRTPGDPESAEVAVVVVDDWHRRGLGTALLDRLTERARENGIRRYTAIVSEDNDVVLDALDRAGATRTGTSGEGVGEIEFVFELPSEGIGERLAAALRAAAQLDFLTTWLGRFAVWRRRG